MANSISAKCTLGASSHEMKVFLHKALAWSTRCLYTRKKRMSIFTFVKNWFPPFHLLVFCQLCWSFPCAKGTSLPICHFEQLSTVPMGRVSHTTCVISSQLQSRQLLIRGDFLRVLYIPFVPYFGSLRRGKKPRMIDICMTQPDAGREVFGPACTSDPA